MLKHLKNIILVLLLEYDLLIKEKKGRFILFHPLIKHEVKHYNYKKERITIAFNCNAVLNHEPSVLNLC